MSLYAVKSADGFAGITVKSTESLATELMVASSEKKKSTTTRKESEMASEYETVEYIVAEMRKRAEEVYAGQAGYPESWKDQMNDDEIREIADRIEAATKHAVTDCNHLGNAAKIREAVDSIYNKLETLDVEEDSYADEVISSVKSDIVAALSSPPRNCDVGTAEEQYKRIWEFCRRHKTGLRCVHCPVNGVLPKNCALIWAQMPYEEGGEK